MIMTKCNTNTLFSRSLLFSQILILVTKIINDIQVGYKMTSWNVTELLINYESGFVRRGLLGHLIFFCCEYFGLPPYNIVLSICIICILLYIYLFTNKLFEKQLPLFLSTSVLMLASPIFSGDWVRKDILIMIFFFFSMKLLFLKYKYAKLLCCLLLCISSLIHESAFFFTFPIIFCVIFLENKSKRPIKYIPLLLPLCIFIMIVISKGNQEVANNILDSWNITDRTTGNSITSLGWPLKFGIKISYLQQTTFTDNGLIFPPLLWGLIILIVYFLLVNLPTFQKNLEKYETQRKFIFILATIQFISILPLFLLGCDYGRWIFYWSSTSICIFLFAPEYFINNVDSLIKINLSFFKSSILFTNDKKTLYILFLILGIPGFVMDTRNYLNSTFIYQIIVKLSSIFKFVF